MAVPKQKMSDAERAQLVSTMRKEQAQRQEGYREQALKLFPLVCGRCTREFEGKNIRELTVHHIDHNHDNNPADGSNWELLCVYCHDHEHTRGVQDDRSEMGTEDDQKQDALSHSPFADLLKGLKK